MLALPNKAINQTVRKQKPIIVVTILNIYTRSMRRTKGKKKYGIKDGGFEDEASLNKRRDRKKTVTERNTIIAVGSHKFTRELGFQIKCNDILLSYCLLYQRDILEKIPHLACFDIGKKSWFLPKIKESHILKFGN